MSQITVSDRLEQKTPAARLQHVLQEEFNLSLREAREVVSTAREILGVDRPGAVIHPGLSKLHRRRCLTCARNWVILASSVTVVLLLYTPVISHPGTAIGSNVRCDRGGSPDRSMCLPPQSGGFSHANQTRFVPVGDCRVVGIAGASRSLRPQHHRPWRGSNRRRPNRRNLARTSKSA